MFCYQCEQTARTDSSAGCATAKGMCGKDATTADLQDLLVHAVKGIAQYSRRARALGAADREADAFVLHALFTTLTNVNFNATRFVGLLTEAARTRDRVKTLYETAAREKGAAAEPLSGPALWQPAADMEGLQAQAAGVPVTAGQAEVGEDIVGLRALILYGLKGVAAYAHHAYVLGGASEEVFAGVADALDFLAGEPKDAGALLEQALGLGRLNLKVMELLDAANTGRFGTPTPTPVRVTPVKGKAILVSGHDLGDLEALLKLTEGKGINVYTHADGRFSRWLEHEARPGQILSVRGPQGGFTLQERGLRPRWFVAGGTGLAPMLSMLRRMAEWQEPQETRLYFGVSLEAELFALDELERLKAELPKLTVVPCVWKPGAGWTGFAGTPVDALRRDLADAKTAPDLYLCGPPALIDAAEAAARDHGVPADHLFSERFLPSWLCDR